MSHGLSRHLLYYIWKTIKQRCYNNNNKDYKYYGGVNIKMSESWRNSFISFYTDMIDSYNKHCEDFGIRNTSLDRIDPTKDYCKENCRWATWKEQNNKQHKRNFKDNTEVTNQIAKG